MRLLKAMQEAERFSPTEQSVIDYMLKNPRDLATLSIRELAERTFTSPAAVFRLCQKLGLKGYNEFKIRFMSEMGRTEGGHIPPVMRRPITDRDAPPDIVRKMAALEIEAIEESCRRTGSWRLDGCALYVTLEPCPMCAGAILNARVPTVVYGAKEPVTGSCGSVLNLFEERYGFHPAIYGGVLAEECAALLQDFFRDLRNADQT